MLYHVVPEEGLAPFFVDFVEEAVHPAAQKCDVLSAFAAACVRKSFRFLW